MGTTSDAHRDQVQVPTVEAAGKGADDQQAGSWHIVPRPGSLPHFPQGEAGCWGQSSLLSSNGSQEGRGHYTSPGPHPSPDCSSPALRDLQPRLHQPVHSGILSFILKAAEMLNSAVASRVICLLKVGPAGRAGGHGCNVTTVPSIPCA